MAKDLLNEAERFLLDHWLDARSLEESMVSVRTKYKEVFQQIVEAVTDAHPKLDTSTVRVTQFYTKEGSIGFGRKAWPEGDATWLPGLWVDGLRLEKLSADDTPAPIASIWIPTKVAKKSNVDLAAARAEILAAAQQILSKDELNQCGKNEPDPEYMLTFSIPPKREHLGMFADADGQRFVASLVSQFDVLARFVPVLDQILMKQL